MTNDTFPRTQYLTVAEIAEDLRVAPMTVYRKINDGTLRAIRLGRRTYRIPAEDYAAYKRTLETEATERQQHATSAPVIPGQTMIPAATDGIAAL